MQTYEKNRNSPMLNQAILELNGVFNVNQRSFQPSQPSTVEKPLQQLATVNKEYVSPILTTEDFKRTMENYRKYVEAYNIKALKEQITIKTYNEKIAKEIQKKPLQRQEQMALIKFEKMIAPLNIWERNERVEEFNRCNRPIAEKYKTHTVKYHTEQVFESILWHYNMQLYKKQGYRKNFDIYIPGELPHIELHSGWITKAKAKNVVRLPICKRTFRRQRKRLEEARILQDYVFEGSARAVKMRLNPEILSITDNYTGKKAVTGNQQVTPNGRTELPYNKVSIRTLLNKSKIKANVNKHSDIRSSAKKGLTSHSFVFYKNTREQDVEENEAGAGKSLTLSDFLRQKIEEPGDLFEKLAAHHYDKHEPLDPKILEKEAFSGTLDRDEYKELVLQDWFKTTAKLWKGKTPYPGSWAKAYNTWNREKFKTHNGNSSNKHIIFERMPELRHRLTSVRRYLRKNPDFQLLFPGDYFDTTRTTAKEGGFEYTFKSWKKRIAYLESKKEEKTATVATAKRRKKRLSDRQKVDNHVKSYLKGKIILDELFTKVDQIGNPELSKNLAGIVKKANLKFQLKNH